MVDDESEGTRLSNLMLQRSSLRRQVTMLCNKLNAMSVVENPLAAKSSLKSLMTLNTKLEEINQLCRDLTFSETEMDTELAKELEYAEKVNLIDIAISEALLSSDDSKSVIVGGGKLPNDPGVKLQKLSLPGFDGNLLEFSHFWDSFQSRVHSNKNLAAIDKYDYLKSCLSGKALEAIRGISYSNEGYTEAIDVLVRRFGRKIPLINAHVTALTDLSCLDSVDDVKLLRKFCDVIVGNVRSLKSLGVDLESNSQILGTILFTRLPLELRVKWQERVKGTMATDESASTVGDDPNCIRVVDLLDFLTAQVEIREEGQQARTTLPYKPSKDVGKSKKTKTQMSTVSALFTDGVNDNAKRCSMCLSAEHCVPRECPQFRVATIPERFSLVRKARLCYNCLSPTHMSRECHSKLNCRRCGQRHHSLLCDRKSEVKQSVQFTPGVSETSSMSAISDSTANKALPVFLQTVQVNLCGPVMSQHGRILLDGCSNRTFIRQEVVDRLQLPTIGEETLTVHHFGQGRISKVFTSHDLTLSSLNGDVKIRVVALACNHLCHPIRSYKIDFNKLPHLKELEFAEDYSRSQPLAIDLLIGGDHLYDVVTDNVVRGSAKTPSAIQTRFGWTLHGPYALGPDGGTMNQSHVMSSYVQDCPVDLLHEMSSLEALGVKPDEMERNDEWIDPQYVHGRFQIALPWKSPQRPMNNFSMVAPRQCIAEGKLTSMQKEAYVSYLNELKEINVIESCVALKDDVPCWYLPHRGVWQKGKLRVVFDGSFGKPSINEMLLTGPNLLNKLPACLTMFRLNEIPVCADVEKAFLQIGIEPGDRDFLRFFCRMLCQDFRFARVPFGLNCSPAILNSCLQKLFDEWESIYPDTVTVLKQAMYCDDLTTSVDSKTSLINLQDECKAIFSSASFNLRGWTAAPTRVLGVQYISDRDVFRIELKLFQLGDQEIMTRRNLVSKVAKIFDPMGFALPCILKCKLLIKSAWVETSTWDEPLPAHLQTEWQNIEDSFHKQGFIDIPRYVRYGTSSQIHVFSDASEAAYAACVYLVNSESTLLFAKCRLSPKSSKMTIPRLELMGALLAGRAIKFLQSTVKELKALPVFFWCDSTCVLSWLSHSLLVLKTFVRNRVKELQDVDGTWRYCPGTHNPADLATRGVSPSKLNQSNLWIRGPQWLLSREDWPSQPYVHSTATETAAKVEVVSLHSSADMPFIEQFLMNFSKLNSAIVAVAWMFRFVRNCQSSVSKSDKVSGALSWSEKKLAMNTLIMLVQEAHFKPEIELLKMERSVAPSSALFSLGPSLDRDTNLLMSIPRNGEAPKVLLPNQSHLSKLLVWQMHLQLYHAGPNRVLCQLQSRYWIPRARQLIKSQLRHCVRCLRHQPRRFAHSEGYLAPFRGTPTRPFAHAGVDHAGPLLLTSGQKMYLLVFVCAAIRAVHLELVEGLDAVTTALAFRRFAARRGCPDVVYSDNAKVFRLLAANLDVEWRFIPERSPWWGGWYERIIGTIKRSLRKTLHRTSCNFYELFTVITEVEAAINCRPLTYVSEEPGTASPLKPSDFIAPSVPLTLPWTQHSGQKLGSRWRYRKLVASQLCRRWRQEYLLSLCQWRGSSRSGRSPRVGEVVFIRDSPRPIDWPLARVKSIKMGTDGFPRLAEVVVRGRTTLRPFLKLCPLETEPPWQAVAKGDSASESSSSPSLQKLPTKVAHAAPAASKAPKFYATKAGRIIKPPKRFDF